MSKRVLIVDFNHMVHTYNYAKVRLSMKVRTTEGIVEKDTTIQNGTLKSINRWSKGGAYPTVVCFDRPVPARRGYFQSKFEAMSIGSGNEYKGNRSSMSDAMYTAIGDCESVLKAAGIGAFASKGYEADDLIYAFVKQAKLEHPGTPIDIVTNDSDLLPLVDDTVSVFLRSKTMTYAEEKSIEKTHYVQVTPKNYAEVVCNLSAYRGFYLPYNTLLLHKLLRGDSSDQFGCKDISAEFSAKKFNAFIERLEGSGEVDFENDFRYSDTEYAIRYRDSGEEYTGDMTNLSNEEKARLNQILKKTIEDSPTLKKIKYILGKYSTLNEEQIERVGYIYNGMNLNQAYSSSQEALRRKSIDLSQSGDSYIKGYNEDEFAKLLKSSLDINLKRYV